jgi:hypothetical protein
MPELAKPAESEEQPGVEMQESSVISNVTLTRDDGLKVSWCQSLDDVPEGIKNFAKSYLEHRSCSHTGP